MRRVMLFGLSAFSIFLASSFSQADEPIAPEGVPPHPCPPGIDCRPRTKPVCFNLVCYYNNEDNPAGFKHCKVAATFVKKVTLDGGEVQDDSHLGNNPEMNVTCDGSTVFNNSAHRYTDLLGTRIQGEMGPHPSISLPRGALHAGAHGNSGFHTSQSYLEMDAETQLLRTPGKCYIWVGAP